MLHPSKLVAMQRLQHSARSYSHHTSGQIDPAKFAALESKFQRAYGVKDSPSAKTRMKRKGFAVAELIAWQQSPSRVHWWLLATTGKGRVWEYEQLKEIQKTRIQIFGGYELVHDGRTWSWKYLESHVQSLRTSIRLAIAHKQDQRLQALIADIYATAGFRLARQQAGHLAAFIRADWIRVREATEVMPAFPTRMLYVRALANEGAATGAGAGKPSKSPKLPKQAFPVPADAAPTLPVEPEGGVAIDSMEPTSQEGLVPDPVVPAEPTWFESDWLAGLVEGEGRRDEQSD
jgi:hypothetical protein